MRTAAGRDHFLSHLEKPKAMFEKFAGPDWETRTVEPELPPHFDRSKVWVPQLGDFDNLKETTTATLLNQQ